MSFKGYLLDASGSIQRYSCASTCDCGGYFHLKIKSEFCSQWLRPSPPPPMTYQNTNRFTHSVPRHRRLSDLQKLIVLSRLGLPGCRVRFHQTYAHVYTYQSLRSKQYTHPYIPSSMNYTGTLGIFRNSFSCSCISHRVMPTDRLLRSRFAFSSCEIK